MREMGSIQERATAFGGTRRSFYRSGDLDQEQNLAPNFTRVSGQLLSIRRTTRAMRIVDFISGVSAL